jgi:hypothetical protein
MVYLPTPSVSQSSDWKVNNEFEIQGYYLAGNDVDVRDDIQTRHPEDTRQKHLCLSQFSRQQQQNLSVQVLRITPQIHTFRYELTNKGCQLRECLLIYSSYVKNINVRYVHYKRKPPDPTLDYFIAVHISLTRLSAAHVVLV